jgi:putative redox protein
MVSVKIGSTPYKTEVRAGEHSLISDEPPEKGGADLGPTPSQLLLTSLGTCVAITLKMYSDHKGWDPGEIRVELTLEKQNGKGIVHRKLFFEKDLTEDQLERLKVVAGKCPISKMVTQGLEVVNEES